MSSLGDSWRETKRVSGCQPARRSLVCTGVMFGTPAAANRKHAARRGRELICLPACSAHFWQWSATRPDVVSCGPLPPDLPPIASFRGHRHTSQTSRMAVFEKGLRRSPQHYSDYAYHCCCRASTSPFSPSRGACPRTYSLDSSFFAAAAACFLLLVPRFSFPFPLVLLPPPSPPCLSIRPSTASKATTFLGNGRNRSYPASDGLFPSLLACLLVTYPCPPCYTFPTLSSLALVFPSLFARSSFLSPRPPLLPLALPHSLTHSLIHALHLDYLARCRSGRSTLELFPHPSQQPGQEKPAPPSLSPDRSSSSSSSSAQPTHEKYSSVDGMGWMRWARRRSSERAHIFHHPHIANQLVLTRLVSSL
ncbi:uncharacterized protein J3D65DRAFT_149967 [Phyllosticta citribraziliensis]|uniref:Uncharacterized protein n=1 Tax=Phyllosticta citribraziliensis TaxID=989973 RepID=A0ABR1L4Q0_9PEZI